MKVLALPLKLLIARLGPARTKDARDSLAHGLFPVGDLSRVDVVLLGDLLNCFDALERLQAHAGFELGIVSFSFCFHSVLVRFGLQPAPNRHNHSLTPGPIFGVRLRISPLILAAIGGSKEVVELLIANGADVNAKMLEVIDHKVFGETPLDMADDKETADLLRKHGGKTKKELEAAGN